MTPNEAHGIQFNGARTPIARPSKPLEAKVEFHFGLLRDQFGSDVDVGHLADELIPDLTDDEVRAIVSSWLVRQTWLEA